MLLGVPQVVVAREQGTVAGSAVQQLGLTVRQGHDAAALHAGCE